MTLIAASRAEGGLVFGGDASWINCNKAFSDNQMVLDLAATCYILHC